MLRNKASEIRIYPNQSERKQIMNTIGCCRFVFNQMLAERIEVYEEVDKWTQCLDKTNKLCG
jgi:putative transposase